MADRERSTYGRELRVRKRREYLEIQRRGRKRDVPHFVVVTVRTDDGRPSRLGITASKKIGGAVERNHVKRRVREFFRRSRRRFERTVVAVVIAKPGAAELSQAAIDRELEGAFGLA